MSWNFFQFAKAFYLSDPEKGLEYEQSSHAHDNSQQDIARAPGNEDRYETCQEAEIVQRKVNFTSREDQFGHDYR